MTLTAMNGWWIITSENFEKQWAYAAVPFVQCASSDIVWRWNNEKEDTKNLEASGTWVYYAVSVYHGSFYLGDGIEIRGGI